MSLRDMFFTIVRTKLYTYLKGGLLREWGAEVIYKLVDDAINEKQYDINLYLRNYVVTLENMDSNAEAVVKSILLPYIYKKRVE